MLSKNQQRNLNIFRHSNKQLESKLKYLIIKNEDQEKIELIKSQIEENKKAIEHIEGNASEINGEMIIPTLEKSSHIQGYDEKFLDRFLANYENYQGRGIRQQIENVQRIAYQQLAELERLGDADFEEAAARAIEPEDEEEIDFEDGF